MPITSSGSSVLSTNRKVKIFAASILEDLPYIRDSKSWIKEDDIKNKKAGASYEFYIPDPGKAYTSTFSNTPNATTPNNNSDYGAASSFGATSGTNYNILDISQDNRKTEERAITGFMNNTRASCDLGSFTRLSAVEDYYEEIVKPRASTIAAETEQNAINSCVWVSDHAEVTTMSAINLGNIGGLSAKLKGARVGGKLVGYADPEVLQQIAGKLTGVGGGFVTDSEIYRDIYKEYFFGQYAMAAWVTESFMPKIVTPSAASTITAISPLTQAGNVVTVTGTNLYVGMPFEVTGIYCVTLSGMKLFQTKTFFLESVDANGTTGTVAGGAVKLMTDLSTDATYANNNPNCWGANIALWDVANITFPLNTNLGKNVFVLQVRDSDNLNWTTYKHPELVGCKEETVNISKISFQSAAWADVRTRVQIQRFDLPYIAVGVDTRLSRLLYVVQ